MTWMQRWARGRWMIERVGSLDGLGALGPRNVGVQKTKLSNLYLCAYGPVYVVYVVKWRKSVHRGWIEFVQRDGALKAQFHYSMAHLVERERHERQDCIPTLQLFEGEVQPE